MTDETTVLFFLKFGMGEKVHLYPNESWRSPLFVLSGYYQFNYNFSVKSHSASDQEHSVAVVWRLLDDDVIMVISFTRLW